MIEIKKSPIHGVGVFATEFIPIGTYITKYPARDKNLHLENIPEDYKLSVRDTDYLMRGKDGRIFVPDTSSRDLEACGHLINDALTFELPEEMDVDKHLVPMLRYYRDLDYNVELGEDMCAVKDIHKGEELITKYGYGYWVTRKNNRQALPEDLSFVIGMMRNPSIVEVVKTMRDEKSVVSFIKCCLAYGKQLALSKNPVSPSQAS